MWMLGLAMGGTVYIQCVMAVGLTVDYMIHITHSFAEALPEGDVSTMSHHEIYAAKLEIAMNSMGVSVCKGAFTTFVGVLCLALAHAEAFRIFFKMFIGIVVIAIVHGMILTPALLAECRFVY